MTVPASVGHKLARADEHKRALIREVARYAELHLDAVSLHYDQQRLGYVAKVNDELPKTDEGIGLVLGDALVNLRAALDHSAWGLADPSRRGRGTTFPIWDDRLSDYRADREATIRDIQQKVPGISAAAEALIESVQPYHRVDDPGLHPLALLRDLNDFDKHRELHIAVGAVTEFSWQLHSQAAGDLRLIAAGTIDGTHKRGAEICFIPRPREDLSLQMQGAFSPVVVLDDAPRLAGPAVLDLFEELRRYVEGKITGPLARLN